MIKRSQRLTPIARLAERAEHQAAAACGVLRDDMDACSARLEELRAARAGYLGAGAPGVSVGAGRLRETHRFLNQLDAAIVQLEWQLERKRSSFERQRASWYDKRVRTEALGNVIKRSRLAEHRAELEREQREVDDRPPRPPAT